MRQLSFKRHRFPPEIIRHSVWLYARFTLSFRDVEDLLAERGLDLSYETVRRWFLKFGSAIAANLRRSRPRPSDHWHLDEMEIVIRRKPYWLWRAVDNEGEVLDFLVQRKRDAKTAKKLMKKLLKKQGFAPSRVVTDKLRSYPPAFRALGLTAEHVHSHRANNRAENSHQPVRRRERKCKSSSHPARRNASSTSILRPTTPSIISATSTDDPFTKSFEPHPSMLGKPRVPPPDHRSLPSKFSAAKFM